MRSLVSQGLQDDLEIIVQDGDVEQDAGQSDALNKGFAKARGEWLFWLNSDDVLLSGALSKVKSMIARHSEANWIAGNQIFVDESGRVKKCIRANAWHDFLYRGYVPHVNGTSSFFRRSLFLRMGGMDAGLEYCLDWDLWIRFLQAGERFVRTDDYLWAQRQWAGSKTQRPLNAAEMDEHLREVERMLAKRGFRVSRWGALRCRLWRVLNGNYFRSMIDTARLRGRKLVG